MNAASDISTSRHWLLPTCGEQCRPGDHDPRWHETVGLLTALRTPPATVVRTGPLTVDLWSQVVTVHGRPIHLTEREYQILSFLAVNLDRRCSAEEIIAPIWGKETARHWRQRGHVLRVNLTRMLPKLGPAADLFEAGPSGGPGWRRLRLEPTDA